MKIYFDGGCRPNPGEMQAVAVARGVAYHLDDLGRGTSEKAEWLALLHGLRVAEMIGVRDIVLLGDAAGVIAQASGEARCRNPAFLDQYRRHAEAFDRVRLRYIRRNQNLAGIALGKLGER
jgi:ribonuclease HI